MPTGWAVSIIKKQVFAPATAFSLSFCIETRGVLLVFASSVARIEMKYHRKTEGLLKE